MIGVELLSGVIVEFKIEGLMDVEGLKVELEVELVEDFSVMYY